jgi:hypothetical protein
VPWYRAILADSLAGQPHEGTSSVALKVVDVHVLRTNTSSADCAMLAEAPRGTAQCSMALGSHPGSCEGFHGWDAAECLHSSYVLAAEAACRLHPRPWVAWHFACDAKHSRRMAKVGCHDCQSGTAQEVTLDLGCDHGFDLA